MLYRPSKINSIDINSIMETLSTVIKILFLRRKLNAIL